MPTTEQSISAARMAYREGLETAAGIVDIVACRESPEGMTIDGLTERELIIAIQTMRQTAERIAVLIRDAAKEVAD